MNVQIQTASDTDAGELIKRGLRTMSVREMEVIKPSPVDLAEGLIKRGAYSWTGKIDNKIICMWGIERPTLISRTGHLWFLSTNEVNDHIFLVARKSKLFIEEIMKTGEFNYISGVVDSDFKRSIKWLQWLGFRVLPAREDGFRVFEMWRH